MPEGPIGSAAFIAALVLAGLWKPSVRMAWLPQTAGDPRPTPSPRALDVVFLKMEWKPPGPCISRSKMADRGVLQSRLFWSLQSIQISERRLNSGRTSIQTPAWLLPREWNRQGCACDSLMQFTVQPLKTSWWFLLLSRFFFFSLLFKIFIYFCKAMSQPCHLKM